MKFFDLDCTYDEARVVVYPVPWDVTTSYGKGTANGPEAMLRASEQIDPFSPDMGLDFEHKYFMTNIDQDISKKCEQLKKSMASFASHDDLPQDIIETVNKESDNLNEKVYLEAKKSITAKKIPATLGGDHSIPLGAIKAVAEAHKGDYSILHIDAHHDFRKSYQGFTHSHASIFHNVMTSTFKPKSLVQVGIRDFCEEEYLFAKADESICCFYDRDLKELECEDGVPWKTIADQITKLLSDKVYISVDIDGFDPKLCPGTGTPVPGGIDLHHFVAILKSLKKQSKQIIGFDLVEVAPSESSEWDANVGMRVLFELCKFASNSLPK